MARARNIKPGFFTNEELVELPFSTRLLFIGLWTIADREGRLEDKPKRIKMHLFPADDINVDEALCELQASGFLKRYEVDGARYIQVLAFRKHQNPHRDEKPSSIPAMDEQLSNTVQAPCKHGANPADSPIPDSPIPDPLNIDIAGEAPAVEVVAEPAEVDRPTAAAMPPPQDPPAAQNPALVLTLALRPLGVSALSTHPAVIAWADRGVSIEVLAEAVRMAREHKPTGSIPPNYLAPIVDKLLNPGSGRQRQGGAGPENIEQRNARIMAELMAQDAGTDPGVIDVDMEEVVDAN